MESDIVPVVAIISSFIFYLGAVIASVYFAVQKRKMLNTEILAAIEKGIDIPIPQKMKVNYRKIGIIFTLPGVIIALALWVTTGSLIGLLWGMIPLMLGISFLVIGKKNNS